MANLLMIWGRGPPTLKSAPAVVMLPFYMQDSSCLPVFWSACPRGLHASIPTCLSFWQSACLHVCYPAVIVACCLPVLLLVHVSTNPRTLHGLLVENVLQFRNLIKQRKIIIIKSFSTGRHLEYFLLLIWYDFIQSEKSLVANGLKTKIYRH